MSKNYQSLSLSEKYDSRTGFTTIDKLYNNNGNQVLFTEIIKGKHNPIDLQEELQNDFLSLQFDNVLNNNNFFNKQDMIQLNVQKRKKISQKKKTKRKTSK
jgi:hypothetical protein